MYAQKVSPSTAARGGGGRETSPLLHPHPASHHNRNIYADDTQADDADTDDAWYTFDARVRSVGTHLRIARLAAYSATLAMFALVLALFVALITLPFGHHRRTPRADVYGGKTLAPANYSVVGGLFVQSDPGFNATGYDMLRDGFGLRDKSPERWSNFTSYMASLNADADEHTTYKVIFIARHGQGWHNVAEAQYGTPAWNCYWSLQDGDGELAWGPDALLTPLGEGQAAAANAGWKEQLKDGAPLPQSFYSSPLRRSASTLNITWHDIALGGAAGVAAGGGGGGGGAAARPIIKENLREMVGLHTCDLRSSKSLLASTYPGYTFEPSFTEHDPLWDPVYQETDTQEAVRIRLVLNEIFATDPATFVSITVHSGVINAFFMATGHPRFQVQTGGFVPVVLKAVSYPSATFEPITKGQSATAPACTADPTERVVSPAAVTVAPTWYPACAGERDQVLCRAVGVTGHAPGPTETAKASV